MTDQTHSHTERERADLATGHEAERESSWLDPAEDRRQVLLNWFDASACRAAATVLEEYAVGELDYRDEDPEATLECARDLRAIAERWHRAPASRTSKGE